tara:strand:- start:30345 stop:30533 length:189 start_codon:yes stop_codon:yes gene_type:complete
VQPVCQNAHRHRSIALHFIKQVAGKFCGIFVIPILGFGDGFFSFHISGQRKEAKERRLFRTE